MAKNGLVEVMHRELWIYSPVRVWKNTVETIQSGSPWNGVRVDVDQKRRPYLYEIRVYNWEKIGKLIH